MLRFRTDVEGLRGVAVLLVVLDHLRVPGLGGGFFGVDVFFVISGYLITSLLAAEFEQRRTVSIAGFYLRRARRILPAALTVIAAVVVAADLVMNELQVAQIRHDAVWTVFFASNVNFIHQTTDYYAQGLVDSSPFQHFWSLAVEEQFYLVWPALFLLVARFGGRRWRIRVAAAVCALAGGSLAWSVVATEHAPAEAYFSTFTRAWELGVGALLAIAAVRLRRRVASAASATGVVLFGLSCAVIGAGTRFPGAIALLPTVATALLIAGGSGDRTPLPNRALELAPIRFLGRISYSVYLWHWPLVVFAAALSSKLSGTVQMRLVILVITLVVATCSYYLVEEPGRRIGNRASFLRSGRSLAAAVVGSTFLVATFAGLSAIDRAGATTEPAAAATAPTVRQAIPHARKATYAESLRAWQLVVRAGLAVRELPASLSPLSRHLSMGSPPPCIHGLPHVSADECVVGNPAAAHVAVLDGDSHAEMFRNAVWRAFDRKTWSIHIFARPACGWAGTAENDAISESECARLQAESLQRTRALHPDVLLLSEHLVVTPTRSRAAIAASLRSFTRAAKQTIVLGHTPLPQPWTTCLVGNDISRCFAVLDGQFVADRRVEQTLAEKAGAMFVDTAPWLCTRSGAHVVCPPVIDGVPAYKDTTHVGPEYQFKLIPLVRAMLRSTLSPVRPMR